MTIPCSWPIFGYQGTGPDPVVDLARFCLSTSAMALNPWLELEL